MQVDHPTDEIIRVFKRKIAELTAKANAFDPTSVRGRIEMARWVIEMQAATTGAGLALKVKNNTTGAILDVVSK
jgi:hypothetical protein